MKKRNLAFTVELLGLFILLVLVITVITQVFVMSRSHSLQAKQLTEAVILAESVAEVSSTEERMPDVSAKMDAMENIVSTSYLQDGALPSEGEIWAGALFAPDDPANYKYVVTIKRKTTPAGDGVYAEDTISIYSSVDLQPEAIAEYSGKGGEDMPEAIYTLKAGKYFGEDK